MEMDFVGIAELTGVDAFKCLDFREAFAGPTEGPARTGTQSPRLTPSVVPPTSARKTRALGKNG